MKQGRDTKENCVCCNRVRNITFPDKKIPSLICGFMGYIRYGTTFLIAITDEETLSLLVCFCFVLFSVFCFLFLVLFCFVLFFSKRPCYCYMYLEFKLRYLKKKKRKKKKKERKKRKEKNWNCFQLEQKIIYSFLKTLSMIFVCFWMTLGDFTVKTQNLEGKFLFNQNSIKKKRNVVCGR